MHHTYTDFKKAYNSVRREVLYNALIEFGMPMKLVIHIKMCLNESCNRVRLGKHFSDLFFIRNDLNPTEVLSLWVFRFALGYAIREVQENERGLKLNCTRHFLVYADDVNTLDDTIHSIQKNTEAIIISSKEISLELKAEKTKYMIMSQ